ncbi:hypothetical protein [Paenibacillus glycanilyticus]|uniref:hypothetical protein n=1 Tax=Paenibacillus glycanilyticus TaxID=126569 RepID=UPI000FD7D8CC|nr:hypothetical protein [Paenibacillus glycanilyticus]
MNNKFTKFTGELLSVVKQKDSSFTVTVIKAYPSTENFKEYREFNLISGDFFYITKRTIIYKKNKEDEKEIINAIELEKNRGKQIEFWINEMPDQKYQLEEIEVTILN